VAKKRKFKINEDTMTTIVVSSLLFCVMIIVTGFVFVWFDKDPTSVVTSGSTVFGTELGVCGFITAITRVLDSKDRRAEQRRKRKEEKEDVTNG
jgi:hypothetical protein